MKRLIGFNRTYVLAFTALTMAANTVGAQTAAVKCENVMVPRRSSTLAHKTPDTSMSDETSPLYYIRQQQAQGDTSILKGTENTYEFIKAFAEFEQAYTGERNVSLENDPSQLLRLIGHDSYVKFVKEQPNKSPMELYGYDTFSAWKAADDYLTEIPVGRFKLTKNLFNKVASFSGRSIEAFELKMDLPDLQGILPDKKGSFKKWANFSRSTLTEPLTDAEVKELRANPFLEGFMELPKPWSKPNARRGLILYTLPNKVESKLEELIKWYEANEKTMDPIELATRFQRNFVAIHPFVDGNGRVSRLLMDRILLEHGLPPAVILNHNLDLTLPIKAYTELVRQGVADSINLIKNSWRAEQVPAVQASDLYSHSNANNGMKLLTKYFTNLKSKKILVGSSKLRLDTNGFFYDQYAVPHEYYNGKFYPVTDRMLEYYDIGGKLESKVESGGWAFENGEYKELPPRSVRRRTISPAKTALFKKHIDTLTRIEKNYLDVNKLSVVPYATIAKANKEGDSHIYPWQEKMLIEAFRKTGEPNHFKLALSPNRDTAFTPKEKQPAKDVIAQYEHMDMNLYELQKSAAQSNLPTLEATILAKRAELHEASRALLKPYFDGLAAMPATEKAALEKDFRFRVFDNYLKISKLNYPTFAEAKAAGADDYVPVIRSANKIGASRGFVPTQVYAETLAKIPRSKEMMEWTKKFATELQTEKGAKNIDAMYNLAVWMKPEARKAAADKLKAEIPKMDNLLRNADSAFFWDYRTQLPVSIVGDRLNYRLDHRATGDDRESVGQSFSTTPTLYFNGGVFGEGSGKEVGIYFVKAPRDRMKLSYTSPFSGEFEIVSTGPITKKNIVTQLSSEQAEEQLDGASNPVADKFIKDQFTGSAYDW
ncbi:MAG: Fic family protein [Bdellovibrionota bacterium]